LCWSRKWPTFGLKSLGMKQIRGNGLLVLTDKRVYFKRYYPEKELDILLESIQKIDTVQNFLGKTRFAPLLKIVFNEEETSFQVKNISEWMEKCQWGIHK